MMEMETDGLTWKSNTKNLKYTRFLNIVIPESKKSMKESVLKDSKRKSNPISFEIEYTLGKLFSEEIKLIRDLQIINSELCFRYDFNAVTLFSVLDNNEKGYIKQEK